MISGDDCALQLSSCVDVVGDFQLACTFTTLQWC